MSRTWPCPGFGAAGRALGDPWPGQAQGRHLPGAVGRAFVGPQGDGLRRVSVCVYVCRGWGTTEATLFVRPMSAEDTPMRRTISPRDALVRIP